MIWGGTMTRYYLSHKRDAVSQRHHFAILRAAMDVFSEHGYNDANLDEIATRANLSKGSIYNHFENKQDLFLSVIEWGEHQLNHHLRETRKRYSDVRDILENSLRAYFRFFEKRESFFRVLVQEKYNFHDDIKSHLLKISRDSMKELEQDIQQGIKEGVLRNVDPHTCAVILVGIANSLFFNWLHGESDIRINNLFNNAMKLIKHGICTQECNNGQCV